MGYQPQVGDHKITQYDTTEKAEIKIDNAVGLSLQEDGTYSMVGDFYHSRTGGMRKYYGKNNQFTQDLQRDYAIEEAKQNLEEKQFFCTNNEEAEVGEDGMIRMTFESYS